MKGKDVLKGLVAAGPPAHTAAPVFTRPSGAIKAVSLGLDRLSAEAAEARALREELASREMALELDPALIDPSIVADRIVSGGTDTKFEALKASIRDNGQQIPIIVRPHPGQEGRYQVACGHRRWRAAADLGRKVTALVRLLADRELVVLQGQENGSREDLSFIERARFALQMQARGFDRDTLSAALNVDKPEVSRLLTVAQGVGEDTILAIGPAAKVGRPRWLKLVAGLAQEGARARLAARLAEADFADADSDRRFALALEAVGSPARLARRRLMPGAGIVWTKDEEGRAQLVCEDARFTAFLQSRLPALIEEFERQS